MNRYADKRLEEATHEAGHALVALLVGVEVRLATIHVLHQPPRVELVDMDAGTLRDRAMIRLGGERALVAYGLGGFLGCRCDITEATHYATRSGDDLNNLRAVVDDLMFEHAPLLGAISIALLQRSTLTGAELSEIAAASPLSPFGASRALHESR